MKDGVSKIMPTSNESGGESGCLVSCFSNSCMKTTNYKLIFFNILITTLLYCCNAFANEIVVIKSKYNEIIEIKCNLHIVSLVCNNSKSQNKDDIRKCNDNYVAFKSRTGKTTYIKSIKYNNTIRTPSAIACVKNISGAFYVIIEFNDGYGFTSGITYDLFYENGNRLTKNGINYDNMMKKLNIPYVRQYKIEDN